MTMEPPPEFSPTDVRDAKAQVLRSIRPQSFEEIRANTVRGQYGEGAIGGVAVPGTGPRKRLIPNRRPRRMWRSRSRLKIGGGRVCRFICAPASACQNG